MTSLEFSCGRGFTVPSLIQTPQIPAPFAFYMDKYPSEATVGSVDPVDVEELLQLLPNE